MPRIQGLIPHAVPEIVVFVILAPSSIAALAQFSPLRPVKGLYHVKPGAREAFLADGLLRPGFKLDYNKPCGRIWTSADNKGNITRKNLILWKQAEILHRTAHDAILPGRSDCQSLGFSRTGVLDPQSGGWLTGMIPGSPRGALGGRAFIKRTVDGLDSARTTSRRCTTIYFGFRIPTAGIRRT